MNKEDEWLYQYPSTTVRRTVKGNGDPRPYYGEGNKLLYQLKNRMSFDQLGQLSMTRFYNNGVVIKAKSVFGQDFIEMYIPVVGNPFCGITLYDLPEVVPPMMWYAQGSETFTQVGDQWVITNPSGIVEVEGVDYIKTYYDAFTTDCDGCQPIDFTICETEELADDIGYATGGTVCQPFTYDTKDADGNEAILYQGATVPYFQGYDWTVPPTPADPENHTIYSFWGHSQAEIIKFDVDSGGSYFLWKAYTEWSNMGPEVVTFSRTGLGYMLMQAFIDNGGERLCESDQTIIKVDCCEKAEDRRLVQLWWEECTFGWHEIWWYGTLVLCRVPEDVMDLSALYDMVFDHGGGFYVFPEVKGGCIPIEWTLNGRGTLTPALPNGQFATYAPPPDYSTNCSCEPIIITVRDRCGTEDVVTFDCCNSTYPNPPGPVSIGYTTLAMHINEVQELTASGGCGPWAWSLSGGGSIEISGICSFVCTYTAPATNPNCADHPVITLTDCCGNTDSITLNVTANPDGNAYGLCTRVTTGCHCYLNCDPPDETLCRIWEADTVVTDHIVWDCYGNEIHHDGETTYNQWCYTNLCDVGRPCYCPEGDCDNRIGSACCHFQPDNTMVDLRSDAMKLDGCCPINPETGLPF